MVPGWFSLIASAIREDVEEQLVRAVDLPPVVRVRVLLALGLGLGADLDRLGPPVGGLDRLRLPLEADLFAVPAVLLALLHRAVAGEGGGHGEAEDQDEGGDEGRLAAHG